MKACWWLLKREFWEHRRALLVTFGTLLLVCIVLNIWELNADWLSMRVQSHTLSRVGIENTTEKGVFFRTLAIWLVIQRFLFEITGFIFSFRYFLQALSSEQTGKNVMFWRSLPVTDLQTVFVKLLFGCIVIPLFIWLASTCAYLVSITLYSINFSTHQDVDVLFTDIFPICMASYSSMVIYFPVFVVWSGLAGGWLMLWSAISPRLGGLFAIMFPLLGLVVLTQANSSYPDLARWLTPLANFLSWLDLSLLPGSMSANLTWTNQAWDWDGYMKELTFVHMYSMSDLNKLLTSPRLWISGVTGCIFTICAAQLRRFKSE